MEHVVFTSAKPAALLCFPLATAHDHRTGLVSLMRTLGITHGLDEWQFVELTGHAHMSLAVNHEGDEAPCGSRQTILVGIPAVQNR
jgi:hypothetical protein